MLSLLEGMGEEATARCVEMAWQVTVNQCQVLVDTIKKNKHKKKIEVAAELAANNNGSASFTD